jgi:hypothetical protein
MTDNLTVVGGSPQNTTFGVPGTQCVVDATFGAYRATLKPNEFINQGVGGGHFKAAATSGALTTPVGAGSAVFSMRWSPPNGAAPLFLLKRLQVGWTMTTAFTAAQAIDFDVVRCTAFTVADSAGTALTPFTGNNNKVRSGLMATSVVNDMRIASTAALTAGTKTQDANPFAYLPAGTQAAANTALLTGVPLTDVYADTLLNEHPETFAANEGFNIRAVTVFPAAGVIKLYVAVEWAEVPGL